MVNYLEFEKPIEDIDKKIEKINNSEVKDQNLITSI